VPAASLLSALALVIPAAAHGSAPREFFGVVPQSPPSADDFDRMGGVIGTLRVPVEWFRVESRPHVYDFEDLDRVIGEAADAGIRVLPFVYGSPTWLTGDPARPPLASATARRAWTALLCRLVRRYGAGGSFWRGRVAPLPIRRWQIWNEPNYRLFWRPRPSPRGYARLLRASAQVIRRLEPSAKILTAGVAPVEAGITPWSFLRRMYAAPDVARYFDVVALHPYAPYVEWVDREIRFVRRVMVEAGDGSTSLQLTELGVASDGVFPNSFDKGPMGQAEFLREAYRLVLHNRRRWHVSGLDWFTWRDAASSDPHCVFCEYGGLLADEGAPKPAWWAFRHVVQRTATHSGRGV
jgi:polysaccharide biosynthesis protein PslG